MKKSKIKETIHILKIQKKILKKISDERLMHQLRFQVMNEDNELLDIAEKLDLFSI
jgi:hypothetical protein